MPTDDLFMRRCFDLARLGAGWTSPNPMVGAVLVYEGQILGEGWHRAAGKPHAEVNALAAVPPPLRHLIPASTLYVSLEPCCLQGRTPPCTELILREGIPRVVVSMSDFSPGVNGTGVRRLREAGVSVTTGVLPADGARLALIRNTFTALRRPYVVLKMAVSANGYMGLPDRSVWLSNDLSRRLSHRLRHHFDAIMVGTNTTRLDNPSLDNRFWWGRSPLRIALDRHSSLPAAASLRNDALPTWIIAERMPDKYPEKTLGQTQFIELPFNDTLIPAILEQLGAAGYTSLLVEGGANTLTRFIQAHCWDEAWVIHSTTAFDGGIPAPAVPGKLEQEFRLGTDRITVFRSSQSQVFLEQCAGAAVAAG